MSAANVAQPDLAKDVPIVALSFEEAIARATADTPRIASARASVLRSEAQVQLSRSTWLPTFGGVGTYTRLDDDRIVGNRIAQAADAVNLSAQLFVPLIVPQRWLETSRSKETVEAAVSNEVNARRLAVVDVSRAYIAVVVEQQALMIAERAVETTRKQLELVNKRRAEGVGSRLEEVRAERELHDNEARAAARRSALRQAQEALGVATFTDTPVSAAGAVEIPPLPSLADALALVGERPDLVALKTRTHVAERRVKEGWLDYLPTLSGQAQVWYQNPPTLTLPDLGWQAQLVLSVPLYDGGRRYGDQTEREALFLENAAALRDAELRAAADVRATAAEVDNRFDASVQAQASAVLSQESLTLARLAFREGTGTQLDLIEAERSARDAETGAVIAESSLLQAKLLYRLAAGLPLAPASPSR